MTTNHYSATAKGLISLSNLADHVNNSGNIDEGKRDELKKKIRSAQRDNLFAAMAAYCQK